MASLFQEILCKHTNPILSDSYKTVSLDATSMASAQLKWSVLYVLHCEIWYLVYSDTKSPVHVLLDRFNCILNYNIYMVYT